MSGPTLITLDASAPLEDVNKILERDGGVIIANFLPMDIISKAMKDVDVLFARRKRFEMDSSAKQELGADFFPEGTQRVYGLLGKIPDFIINVMRHELWRGVMDHFLSDEFFAYTGDKLIPQRSGYMLASTAALRIGPGAEPQPLHRDQLKFQTRPDPSNPLFTPMVGCLVAGTNCTFKNGATAVIPGSHLWAPDRIPKKEECCYAEMAPGSALFTLGSTYHGAGKNVCEPTDPDAVRTILGCFGQRDYYRPDQDEVFSTPLEIARSLPEDILKVAGWYKSVGGGGYVEDHQHPVDFLRQGIWK
ncbi:hypothetical protein CC79DRAFT_146950 [Sarocladium strictum]